MAAFFGDCFLYHLILFALGLDCQILVAMEKGSVFPPVTLWQQ